MSTDGDQRIIAVVVTYNRLPLVRRLVERLVQVPQLDEVLVIDNASRDGTGDWLSSTLVQEAAQEFARMDLPASASLGRRHAGDATGTPRSCTGRCRRTAAEQVASTTGWAGRSTEAPTWSG